jgi:hypothetical protein
MRVHGELMDNQGKKKIGIAFLAGIFSGAGIISIILGFYFIYDLSVNGNVTSKYWYYLLTGVCCVFASRQMRNIVKTTN